MADGGSDGRAGCSWPSTHLRIWLWLHLRRRFRGQSPPPALLAGWPGTSVRAGGGAILLPSHHFPEVQVWPCRGLPVSRLCCWGETSCSDLLTTPTQHWRSSSLSVLLCQSNAGCSSCSQVRSWSWGTRSQHRCFAGCRRSSWDRPLIPEGALLAEVAPECPHGSRIHFLLHFLLKRTELYSTVPYAI